MKTINTLLAGAVLSLFIVSCGGNNTPKVEKDPSEVTIDDTTKIEKPIAASENLENGKVVYNQMCQVCHSTGAAGAAKIDNKTRWEESLAKGIDTLQSHAIHGYTGKYGVMPAKGGNANFSDQDVKDAIAYMLSEAKVK